MEHNKESVCKKFIKITSSYRVGMGNYYLGTLIEISVQNLLPLLLACIIDEIIYYCNMKSFLALASIYAIIYLGYSINSIIYLSMQQYTDNTFVISLKNKVFKKIIFSNSMFLDKLQSGEAITLIIRDTNEFFLVIRKNLIRFINEFFLYGASLLFIALLNFKMAILVFILVPVSIFSTYFIGKKVESVSKVSREKYGTYISWVLEVLKGLRDIKIFACEKNILRIFVNKNKEIIHLKNSNSSSTLKSKIIIDGIYLVSDLTLYLISAILVFRGEITIGTFIAFTEYFAACKLSLNNIIEYILEVRSRKASIDRVLDLFDREDETIHNDKKDIIIKDGEVEFKDVSFSYDNCHNRVLDKINFKINSNERISLVGKSGAGKSTVAYMLLGFYIPEEGKILIDGQDISQCNLKSLRKNIGIIQQQNMIFDNTIRFNIILGSNKYTEEEIWKACDKAYISDFIRTLPNGLDTVIGKNGMDLSGGQKQRLSIARTLLKNPKILILDEATSALDSESEKEVQKALSDLLEDGKTIIIITHRLNSILECNRTAVLDEGKIVACDNHLSLLQNCSNYRSIFEEQYLKQGGIQ